MGIACAYIRLRDQTIEKLLRAPRQIHTFIGGEEPPLAPSGGFLARFFGPSIPEPAPVPEEPLEEREEDDEGDVDKAWNAIHYLLTGEVEETDHPLGFLVSGGVPIGAEDVGYGPVRAFTSRQISAIADQLQPFDRASLYARYRPKDMDRAGVYPQIWARDGDDAFNYAFDNFEALRVFLREAQQRQVGLLIYFC